MTILSKKSRVKFTDTLSLGALKRTDNLPRTKSVKSHKASLIPLPDQVEAFLSWQMGPFPEKRSGRHRLVLTAEIKRVTRVIKTLSALERVKEGITINWDNWIAKQESTIGQATRQAGRGHCDEEKVSCHQFGALGIFARKGRRPPPPNLTPLFAQMEESMMQGILCIVSRTKTWTRANGWMP